MTKTKIFFVLATFVLSLALSLQQTLAFEWSSLSRFLPAAQAPEASHDVAPYKEPTSLPDVTNLRGEPIIDGVILTWDPVLNANMYTIYFGQNSVTRADQSYEKQLMVTATNTHTVTALTGGTKYYFAIAAEDSTGKYLGSYNYSNEIAVSPLQAPSGQVVTPTPPVVPTTPTPSTPVIQADILDATLAPTVSTTPTPVLIDPTTLQPLSTTTKTPATTTARTPSKDALPGTGPEVLVVIGISALGSLLIKRRNC